MDNDQKWIGKSVSIYCTNSSNLGIFQGTIKKANPTSITIVRAFRNGVPLKQQDMQITISSSDIVKLNIIPVLKPDQETKENGASSATKSNKPQLAKPPTNEFKAMKIMSKSPPDNNAKFFSNMTQSKDEAKTFASNISESTKAVSKPIDVIQPKSAATSTPFKNDKRKSRRFQQNPNKNQTFGTSVDDPLLDEDFDFEKNLALFDKQAIWNQLDATQTQKPDLLRQTMSSDQKKFRHDENILASEPTQYRQIQVDSNNEYVTEYVTDAGLLIPCISLSSRNKIQQIAEENGLTWDRTCDCLARNATELAIQLLGGARRLTPKNQHQWPRIVILCDESVDTRLNELGLSTGRELASHGLKVVVYNTVAKSGRLTQEIELYKATGNKLTNSVAELPSSDLVILTVRSNTLDSKIIKYINNNRSPLLAVDPPINGISNINIKCSLLPILPLNNLDIDLGKIYLCNCAIPDKYFHEAKIKYKSPFAHKSVIPLFLNH